MHRLPLTLPPSASLSLSLSLPSNDGRSTYSALFRTSLSCRPWLRKEEEEEEKKREERKIMPEDVYDDVSAETNWII